MQTKTISLLLTITTLIFAINPVKAWVEPTTIPPGNNIFAPLNSSAFGQSKIGGLILNIGNAAHGLIVKYGLVGIGTDDPQAKLDVAGKVRSTGLEVNSTTEGVLFPRMSTAERDSITNLSDGLIIYNNQAGRLEIYAQGKWSSVGGDGLPKGTIAFFNLSSCPSGWVEKTELKGRYPVGLPSSGVLGQSVGSALSSGENRSVGQHNHGISDPGHAHGVWDGGHAHGVYDPGHNHTVLDFTGSNSSGGRVRAWQWYVDGVGNLTSTSGTGIGIYSSGANIGIYGAGTGIGVNNAGSVAGTNAPYLQLLACEKQTEGGSFGGSVSSPTTNSFGDWKSYNIETINQAETDGFVSVMIKGYYKWGYVWAYTDSNNPPTTMRAAGSQDYERTGADADHFLMPVKKGDYWKVSRNGGEIRETVTIYWMPLGN